ncbi:helicase-associated domain-containing protein [Williamsia sp. CHRR-6]|uniref:helicase-associated domain-containing protein n=1 Tax=Williamsia sp. CHRR-6 TaxID=2835871 RepID=UPI001BD93187|nr:helicase-associated domain-containing protein [Williamsia sp. CHRR-6]MBT0566387.1 helicase-associated domain-containing protein [Williamsia sp. CHRR-6]
MSSAPHVGAGSPGRRSLAEDLASRTDAELIELFTTRPDLAAPPPAGVSVLAQRAAAAASINLAAEAIDLLGVAVLEVILDEAGLDTTSTDAVLAALTGRAEPAEIRARIDQLRKRAIVWGPDDALSVAPHGGAALPTRAHHLNGPLAARTLAEITELLDSVSERERELLTTLATGSPLGRTRDADPSAPADRPVPRMIGLGLLARVDDQTVELPPVVGALLRGETTGEPGDLREPTLSSATGRRRFTAGDVEAAAGGEALELLRHLADTIEALGRTPALQLRAGGLGVRELRKLVKVTGLPAARQSFVLELAVAARLVDNNFPDPPLESGENAWTPTVTADQWLHQVPERRWHSVAESWLTLPRRPWQVGEAGIDGATIPTLAGELHDTAAIVERRIILGAMASGKPGVPVDLDELGVLTTWRHPRWQRRLTRTLIEATLDEARALGVVAHGALSAVGRELIAAEAISRGIDADTADARDKSVLAAMARALPEPIDFFLTQADLTVTAPGPLVAELSAELSLVADLESGGAASVYRITDESIRRALDTGRTGTELIGFFTAHSKTPVPQSLEYLIDDVARRHGQLRVGVATAFIRCEDATTLAAVLSNPVAETLALRALAPTVAVSQAPLKTVLDELRAAGFAPAGEDSSGDLVDLRERGARVPAPRTTRRPAHRPPTPSAEQLGEVVDRMRAHDVATAARSSSSVRSGGGESATALLNLARKADRRVRIGYVDAHGSASTHVVVPRQVGAGQLIAAPHATAGPFDESHFALHRITSVELLVDDL